MDEKPTDPGARAEPTGPDATGASGPSRPPSHAHHDHPHVDARAVWVLAIAVLVALAFGAWGAWRVLSPESDDLRGQLTTSEASRKSLQAENDDLQQQVATLKRSDQISRDANLDVQRTLSERDEEIAGLRADVAFYERLVGATAQRKGLSVHAIRFQPQGETAWHFTSTLTQNLNRGSVSAGDLRLEVEGTRAGKREVLAWTALRQDPAAEGLPYSFKYFQQVDGDVFLPDGFAPVRVTVKLKPRSGNAVEQSFTWADATREATAPAPGPDDPAA